MRTHGHAGDHRETPEYRAWDSMKTRCLNPQSSNYPRYGGRGIQVHPEWLHNFEAFLRDVGPRPSKEHTLDRKDNNRHYVPGNVRWVTRSQQQRNKRNSIELTLNGRTQNIWDWVAETGIPYQTLYGRLSRGWSHEKALTTKSRA